MITGKLAQPVSVNTGSKVYFVLTAQTIQGVNLARHLCLFYNICHT